jgi:hypothetical protein
MLILKNKTPVRFEWTDQLSETSVHISPDDDSDTIRAKLQRVLELETGGPLPVRVPGAALAAARETFEPLLDVAAMEAAATKVGWEALASDEGDDLPIHD